MTIEIKIMLVALVAVLLIAAFILAGAYVCYRLAFSVPARPDGKLPDIPETEQYAPYRNEIIKMSLEAQEMPYEEVYVTSYDGLSLFGRCYIVSRGAPWVIMFHGYRSVAYFECGCGLKFAVDSGYNVLLVDQRAHGKSGGKCLTFGIKESIDCRTWVDYVISRAGSDVKIVLFGISMGGATVLMAAERNLPKNVRAIVSDCAFSSPSDVVKKVIRDNNFPAGTYPLLRLGGLIFGGVDVGKGSAVTAMEKCDIPVLIFHGEDDRFIPCEMGRAIFEHCRSPKKEMLTVPDAGHCMSFFVNRSEYYNKLKNFIFRDVLQGDLQSFNEKSVSNVIAK